MQIYVRPQQSAAGGIGESGSPIPPGERYAYGALAIDATCMSAGKLRLNSPVVHE